MYLNRDNEDYYEQKNQQRFKSCGSTALAMLLIVALLVITMCSHAVAQDGPYWSYRTHKAGVGKITKRKKAWGVSHACSAYATVVYQKNAYVRRLHWWRPSRKV